MAKDKEKDDYFQSVYKIVKAIPKGKVTTYGHISNALGSKNKARVVGYALNAAINSDIPCHRVINRNGELSGSSHFATPTLMRELLQSEKIEFTDQVVNLKKHLWIPKEIKSTIS
ncbi:MAG: MGMT family protein [Candidatus Sericytochromatia bacterium]|nr:MGMT family protein [Candidatus Sericytochromatia bacterium]